MNLDDFLEIVIQFSMFKWMLNFYRLDESFEFKLIQFLVVFYLVFYNKKYHTTSNSNSNSNLFEAAFHAPFGETFSRASPMRGGLDSRRQHNLRPRYFPRRSSRCFLCEILSHLSPRICVFLSAFFAEAHKQHVLARGECSKNKSEKNLCVQDAVTNVRIFNQEEKKKLERCRRLRWPRGAKL